MSDDRFKQARRSLIDRHNQRQQQGAEPSFDDGYDDEFADDDATQLVDLESLGGQAPQFDYGSHDAHPGDDATQMMEAPPPGQWGDFGDGSNFGSQPSFGSQPAYGSQPSFGSEPAFGAEPASGGYDPHAEANQVFIPSDDEGGFEGHTQFVNINEFVDQGAHFAPEEQQSGYEGSTQFVDINALAAGPPPSAGGDIANDPVLRQGYQYGPESIQHGEVALVFAQNPLGKQVVLKRVWEGDPSQMSQPLRQRVAQLNALKHPNLVAMNGMLATPTGLWVELDRPDGTRLTAILQQQGPQPLDQVRAWAETAGEVLQTVHNSELAYANLTTDALWIQEDGSVKLEPFDMLRFENRGTLGAFGAPEMHQPPEQRQLSPATDVYSLAAVILAAATGLPFDPQQALAKIEDKGLLKALQSALNPDPAARPQDMATFLKSLKKKGGFDPSELDIKVVAAAAVLLLGLFAGYMYWEQQQAAEEAARMAARQAAAQQATEQKAAQEKASEGESGDANGKAQASGKVADDPRLAIHTSLEINPIEDGTGDAAPSPEKLDKLREQARKHIKDAKGLKDSDALKEYTAAMAAITEAIKLQGGEPSDDERQLLEDLFSHRLVQDYHKDLVSRIEGQLKEGDISRARFSYRKLASVDSSATAVDFFNKHNSASVTVLSKTADEEEQAD